MKQISIPLSMIAALMLAGCSVAPTSLGNNVAAIGGAGASTSLSPVSENSPGSTGSIVPLREERTVVDLPTSGDQMQAASTYQSDQPQGSGDQGLENEQFLSDDERHRRELINRGDLQEGEPLPVE